MRLFLFLLILSTGLSTKAQDIRVVRPTINLTVDGSSVQKTIEIPICVNQDTLLIAPIYKAHILDFHIIEFIVDNEKGEKTYLATYDFDWNEIHCLLITENSDFIREEYSFYSAIEIKIKSTYYYNEIDAFGMPRPLYISQKTVKSMEITHDGHFKVVKIEVIH